MTKSAAQRVAEWLEKTQAEFTMKVYLPQELRREDRQRRQMERAILAWDAQEPFWAFKLGEIARRLRKEAK